MSSPRSPELANQSPPNRVRVTGDVTCSAFEVTKAEGQPPLLPPFHPVCSPLPSVALVYFSKFPYLAPNNFYQRWTRRTSISVPSTMPRWPLPFVPYPSSKDGYWSPVTSTLNWCEEVNIPFSFPLISWRELTLVCFNAIGLLCDHLRCRDRQYFDQFVVYVAWCQGNSKLSPIPT